MTTNLKQLIETIRWDYGKPFCPCCQQRIEACHKCGNKTATENLYMKETMCHLCEKNETDHCRVCRDCFMNSAVEF